MDCVAVYVHQSVVLLTEHLVEAFARGQGIAMKMSCFVFTKRVVMVRWIAIGSPDFLKVKYGSLLLI